ncbi:hypothetical protein K1T71_002592 [Dendrolimus kikuchii]|uniref:Uncharacterized protein n=1 Tax=Dendrolimus kikuchii TaxID=765133 RepID=A0ACC1DDI1_9NEOP|nr:hypothetical protein K1T71_002592 [Dendrolimus kikuchii]
MNNSAAKVGEIFTEAGAAFNRLADMTMLLHPIAETSVSTQNKTPVKRKLAEERTSTPVNAAMGHTQHNVHNTPISEQVTLNMLNAQESEMDVDNLGNDVKLEFESSTEEVTT